MKYLILFFLFVQFFFAPLFAQTQLSVREILNADGSVRLDKDGGYDVEGYKMVIDKDGKPRFLSKTETALSDSGSWSSVGTGSSNGVSGSMFNTAVYALAVYNGELYAGGEFTQAGGMSMNNIARWNGSSWNSVGVGSENGVNGTVRSLAVYNGELYVGGAFTQAGSVSANYIARWNGTSWNSVGTGSENGVSGESNTSVYALAVYNNELYVGGAFTQAGSVSANYIARWNGSSWNSLGTGSNNGMSSLVWALAVYNGELYVGGAFHQAGGMTTGSIARWNGSGWNSVTNNGNGIAGFSVNSLAVYNGELYAGGMFSLSNDANANNIAKWDGSSWSILGTSTANGVSGGSYTYVNAMAVYNGELYVGGSFSNAAGMSANKIARWNGTSWNILGTSSISNGVNGGVWSLAEYNGEIYVGGIFTWVGGPSAYYGGVQANNIARWTISGATDVEENEITPTNFILHQNYPNPFNPSTTISFTIAKPSFVTLKVYDVLGSEVAELVIREFLAGEHTINFDANNLPAGTYYYILQVGGITQVRSMILAK